MTEIIGFIGGFLTTVGTIPQVVRLFQLKRADEISLSFVLMFNGGVAFWLAYGIMGKLPAVIFWNASALGLGALMIYAKLRWGR